MTHFPSSRQIQAFLSVARHLQFTRAARELHMSQPAVTTQINLLEQQLGVRLFHRTKRDVSLTAEGQSLLPVMETISAGFETLLSSSADLGAGRRGKVRRDFGCQSDAAEQFHPLPQSFAIVAFGGVD